MEVINLIYWKIDDDNVKWLPTEGNKLYYKEHFEGIYGHEDTYDVLINHSKASPYMKSIFEKWREKEWLDNK